jgi:hypothetical protein
MASVAEILIKIQADVANAEAGITKINQKMGEHIAVTEKASVAHESLAGSWRTVLGVFGVTASLAGAVAVLRSSIDAALQAERAYTQMRFAINQATDGAFPAYEHAVSAATAATSTYAVVQRNIAQSALQILVTNTGDLSDSMKNLNLVFDLATAKSLSYEQSARFVSMAMTGNIEALGRMLPDFKRLNELHPELDTKSKRAAFGLGELTKALSGATAAMSEHERAIAQGKKTRDDFLQWLGDASLFMLGKGKDGLDFYINAFTKLKDLMRMPGQALEKAVLGSSADERAAQIADADARQADLEARLLKARDDVKEIIEIRTELLKGMGMSAEMAAIMAKAGFGPTEALAQYQKGLVIVQRTQQAQEAALGKYITLKLQANFQEETGFAIVEQTSLAMEIITKSLEDQATAAAEQVDLGTRIVAITQERLTMEGAEQEALGQYIVLQAQRKYQDEQALGFFGHFDRQMAKFVTDNETGFGMATQSAITAFQGMQHAGAEFFFNWFTGKITSLADVVNSFANYAARIMSNVFSTILTNQLAASYVSSGGISGLLGSLGFGKGSGGFDLATGARGGAVEMAGGGVVMNPTRAIVGEAGPEAVIPLDRMGGLGGNIEINIINQHPSADVSARKGTGQDGRQAIEILIKDTMHRGFGRGEFDQDMAIFGAARQGRSR